MVYSKNLDMARVAIQRLISYNMNEELDLAFEKAIAAAGNFDSVYSFWNLDNEVKRKWDSTVRINELLDESDDLGLVKQKILNESGLTDEMTQYVMAILTDD